MTKMGPDKVSLWAVLSSNAAAAVALRATATGALDVAIADPSTGISPNVIVANSDGVSALDQGVVTAGFNYGFNGTSWDRARVANVFKTLTTTVSAEIWLPQAGKKFRLMGYTVSLSGTTASPGPFSWIFQDGDGGTTIRNHIATLATPVAGDTQIGADFGQGQLSSSANNAFTVILSAPLATGAMCINCWGTEE